MSTGESPAELRCSGCGGAFIVSARYARRIRSGERPCRCRTCRHGARKPMKAQAKVTDAERRYWLERFSDYDIATLATIFYNAPWRPEVVAARRAEIMGDPVPLEFAASGQPR